MLINTVYGSGGSDMCVTGFNNYTGVIVTPAVVSKDMTVLLPIEELNSEEEE